MSVTPRAIERLLTFPYHEDPEHLLRQMGAAAEAGGARQFECRAEETTRNVLSIRKGELDRFEARPESGLSVTVRLPNGAQGFATTSTWTTAAVRDAAARALAVARAMRKSAPLPDEREGARIHEVPDVKRHPASATLDERLDLLRRAEESADQSALTRLEVLWGESFGRRVTLTSDDRYAVVEPLHTALEVRARAGEGTRMGVSREVYASCAGLEHYRGDTAPEALATRAVDDALEGTRAKAMPAGRFPAILDPMISGVLAHESFGHMSEYDCVEANWSVLGGRKGDRLGPEGVSITDSGDCASPGGPRGVWVPVDEETTVASPVTILKDGVLNTFMHNRRTAALDGAASTGNGRALNASFQTLVRMRNTFFEPGSWTLDEMLEDMRDGYYVRGSTGGEPSSDGSFVYTCFRAYRVEKGEITTPLRGVTILGNILDYLPRIRGVARDFALQSMFFGGCGKWGQSDLPVGIGGPHLYFEEALFGGERA